MVWSTMDRNQLNNLYIISHGYYNLFLCYVNLIVILINKLINFIGQKYFKTFFSVR